MNNNVLIGVVAAVIVVAAIVFMVGKNGADEPTTTTENNSQGTQQQTNSDTSTSTQTTTGPKSINDLMAAGTNQQCTFSDAGFTGTLYTSSGKARTDFTGSQDGSIVTSHTIVSGSDVYIWVDGQTTGFKTTVNAASQPGTGSGSTATSTNVDVAKKLDYKCSAWTSDSSKFTPPTTVKFTDMSSFQTQP